MSYPGNKSLGNLYPSRRRFLHLAGMGSAAIALSPRDCLATAQQNAKGIAVLDRDPRRPGFHLQPARNWMNDPNGPIYIHGQYHMFFQYNPKAAIWGNMSWNHATSPDMLHWILQPLALTMTPGGPDSAGCFSGSTLAVPNGKNIRVYAFYTGVVRDPEHETIPHQGLKESQCVAWSDDPDLRQWTKRPTPIIPGPPSEIHATGFRDPSVWKTDDTYYMTVGSGIAKVGGCVLLYQSSNLMDWTYLHPLVVGSSNGEPAPDPVDDGEMWECPEMVPLDGFHLLIYSTRRKTFWQSGTFGLPSLRFQRHTSGKLELGAFYAPKSQLDAYGRRILWGWIPEQRSEAEMLKAGWSGMMSLPRWLSFDSDGSLRMRWLPEMASLRRQSRRVRAVGGNNSVVLPSANGEVVCTGSRKNDFELLIDFPANPIRVQYLAGAHEFQIAEKKVPLQSGDVPVVHLFLDGSVAELLFSERIALTQRFYYDGGTAPDITVEATPPAGLEAWQIALTSTHPPSTAGIPLRRPEGG